MRESKTMTDDTLHSLFENAEKQLHTKESKLLFKHSVLSKLPDQETTRTVAIRYIIIFTAAVIGFSTVWLTGINLPEAIALASEKSSLVIEEHSAFVFGAICILLALFYGRDIVEG